MPSGNSGFSHIDSFMEHLEAELDRVSRLLHVEYAGLTYIVAEAEGQRFPTSIITEVICAGNKSGASLDVETALQLSPQAVACYLLGVGRAQGQENKRR